MLPVPWRCIESWNCNTCGLCCKGFDVVLDFPEWIDIVKTYGAEYTTPGLSRIFLRHKTDGTCAFLNNYFSSWVCTLQHMKPMACKLWPFKIMDKPNYGRHREAEYALNSMRLYVYVDPSCRGLRWGTPSTEFVSFTLPEFVDLALGQRRKQFYSTSRPSSPQMWKPT